MNTKVMFSSKEEKWATPQFVYDALNNEFGFTLDAAASDDNAKCGRYYTSETDGLSQCWQGETVFCNPPYGKTIGDWVRKAYQEFIAGDCTVVMLLPARTDTRWFHSWILGIAEIRFVKGRLKFGGAKSGAPFPSMIVVYQKRGENT